MKLPSQRLPIKTVSTGGGQTHINELRVISHGGREWVVDVRHAGPSLELLKPVAARVQGRLLERNETHARFVLKKSDTLVSKEEFDQALAEIRRQLKPLGIIRVSS